MALLDPDRYDAFLSLDIEPKDLALHSREALAASRFITDSEEGKRIWNYTTSDASRTVLDEMKKKAGVRSLKALYRDAGCVDLVLSGGVIELQPWRHMGGERWMLFKNRETIKFPETVSDEELGTALLSELEVSRNGSYEGT
ncbi:contact-dependent growth inhibition system immunity protein [Notoacmeibacter sp. MSK16QG-6]|nr:contact-dependent growth inhibition system immunity protein [Notoacmeibacter sp. MSK16QG-6]